MWEATAAAPTPLEIRQATDRTQDSNCPRGSVLLGQARPFPPSPAAGTEPAWRVRSWALWPGISPFAPLAWGSSSGQLRFFPKNLPS